MNDERNLSSSGLLVRLGDGLIALAFLAVINIEIWVVADLSWSLWQQIVATTVAPVVAGPIIFRSTRPLSAFTVNAVGTYLMVALDYQSDVYQWANLLLLFSVSVALQGRESTIALLAAIGGVVAYFVSFPDEDFTVGVMVVGLWLVVWLLGRVQGARRLEHRLRSEVDIAAELAATRAERLELEAQRTNMARELHDLIGHTVNVMVVHAGAGRRAVENDPAGARQAFETIESTGRSALDELDRVLGVLRNDDPDAPLAPLPGVSALPGLIEEFRAAGLDATITTAGQVDAIPGGIGLTIYRVVQEALTNTLKHGEATNSSVSITANANAVRVVATDDGKGAPAVTNSGRGLAGITERVQLHGGTASFESTDSGFRVECEIPLTTTEVTV